jgi:hypothetical protein
VIDYTDYNPFKSIEVMRACSAYKLLRLMQMNEVYLQSSLSMKNIFALLKFADSYNVQEAKDICFDFALSNSDFFTSSSAENLGFKLYQEVTALLLKAHQGGAGKKPTPKEVTAEDTIVADFKNLYGSADVTGDVSFLIHNEEVKSHRAILSHQSADLNALVVPPDEGKEPTRKAITLDTKYGRISPGAFHAMLKYFYYSDSAVSMLHATELVSFAKDFHLDKLYRVLEKVIGGQEIAVDTVLNVLDVAYNPLMEENPALQKNLKEEGLTFCVNNIDKISFEQLQNMPPVIATHVIQALQHRIGKHWRLIIEASGTANVKVEDLNKGGSWVTTSPRKETRGQSADDLAKSPSKAQVAAEKKDEKKKDDRKKADEKREEKKEAADKKEADKKESQKKEVEKKADANEGSKDAGGGDAKISRSKSKKHDEKEVSTPKK